ncbi:acyl-CoA N-acyltransferase [Massariosphaeria phaeospora]|uniref:Acyl-CoA N-acyltransferase n=1 Tax=Massariosphaeria phaeospora TaxID=100035 RepID=A0A7C8HZJ3_9PLEO|nr:acyl-CoA N-acyltransferase [Massariosphaeria phaeospora]
MQAATSKPTLRLAQSSDLSAIASCWYYAFFHDDVIGDFMHPHRDQHPHDVYWFHYRGIRERFWDWRHQFIVAVVTEDGKEKVVGAADWRRIGEGGRMRELAWLDPRNLLRPIVSFRNRLSLRLIPNRAADPENVSFLDSHSDRYWTGEHAECWDLHVCGVDPDHQGKGIGKMLISWETGMADQEGVSASVLCGMENRGFYRKSGFTEEILKGDGGGIVLFRSAKT